MYISILTVWRFLMKPTKYSLLHLFVFCLLIWQNVYSQLLYPKDYNNGEERYLPPYDPNVVVISPDVEKWMKEKLAKNGEKRAVEIKTDIMGRVKSNSDKTKPEVRFVENKQKRKVVISDMHIHQIEMEPIHGYFEYNPKTKDHNYYLNGKKLSLKEYENLMEIYWKKFDSQNKDKRNLPIPGVVNSDSRTWTAWMTAEEIFALTKNYKEISIIDYTEPEPDMAVASILSRIELSTHAFPNSYTGTGVGVGVVEVNCRDTSIPLYKPNNYTNYCSGSVDTHHSMVVNVVQHASPDAHVFGFRTSTPYPNPDSSIYLPRPPLQVITRSYSYYPNSANAHLYNEYDRDLDNYIYTKRIIDFKSAGNKKAYNSVSCVPASCDTTFYVASPGKALNTITVGAVDPITYNYAAYSKWKNSEVGNEKPDAAMFTDIDMGVYGSLGGTSAATPLLAGFTATLLDQHPFFKRHPALMKAVLLTGETIPILNASSHDQDNSRSAQKITTYSSVAWGTRSWYCEGGNSACFDANNNTEIHITENNIQPNRRYRIAIAWLSEGNYVYQNKSIQQDIDLSVYQNGQYLGGSGSWNNPFEIVDFFTNNSNAPLNITIRRYRNSGGNVLLGYHLRDNF